MSEAGVESPVRVQRNQQVGAVNFRAQRRKHGDAAKMIAGADESRFYREPIAFYLQAGGEVALVGADSECGRGLQPPFRAPVEAVDRGLATGNNVLAVKVQAIGKGNVGEDHGQLALAAGGLEKWRAIGEGGSAYESIKIDVVLLGAGTDAAHQDVVAVVEDVGGEVEAHGIVAEGHVVGAEGGLDVGAEAEAAINHAQAKVAVIVSALEIKGAALGRHHGGGST